MLELWESIEPLFVDQETNKLAIILLFGCYPLSLISAIYAIRHKFRKKIWIIVSFFLVVVPAVTHLMFFKIETVWYADAFIQKVYIGINDEGYVSQDETVIQEMRQLLSEIKYRRTVISDSEAFVGHRYEEIALNMRATIIGDKPGESLGHIMIYEMVNGEQNISFRDSEGSGFKVEIVSAVDLKKRIIDIMEQMKEIQSQYDPDNIKKLAWDDLSKVEQNTVIPSEDVIDITDDGELVTITINKDLVPKEALWKYGEIEHTTLASVQNYIVLNPGVDKHRYNNDILMVRFMTSDFILGDLVVFIDLYTKEIIGRGARM